MAAAAAATLGAGNADAADPKAEVAEGTETADGAQPAKGKGKLSRKKLMMIGGGVLLLAVLGGGAYVMGVPAMLLGAPAEGEHAAAAEETVGLFFDMPEMLVNLSSSGKKLGFLKLRVALELGDEEAKARVEAVMPRIVDTFQTYLRGLRMEDLNGSAGLYRLREELLMRVRSVVKPVDVKDVLFKDMLVQ